MDTMRRIILKATMAGGTLAVAAGANLLTPSSVLAAWPAKAFEATKMDAAMDLLTGKDRPEESADITVVAPDIAENGAVVSVKVTTTLPKVESISVYVPVNSFPLSASYILSNQMETAIAGRIKMAKTADIVAIVKSNGKLYTAKKGVKVTLGGCGG
ncbi:MAG: thiosulfate oxidation carrier protein SoxY [Gammaproteobacteria bacterium]|nr:thiosulfate oxidation carrier protein SoxY [Gammaproteobacteria bacterium]MCW8987082.1 thiosulfate oxidation carrier protein SoxY [Gammaproteobacteria bacterium]MCW9031627.1 thiosulfate oxidation carrier protein SoxY [Gammaproteobacteria bacterium]